jgi:ABC-type sugar transport system ATPase subunit
MIALPARPHRRDAHASRADGNHLPADELEVRALSVTRGSVLALDAVDMHIPHRGTIHALLGQNGSGKSSLLSILSGQLRPDAGEIFLAGRRLSHHATAERQSQVAMVSQETALAPDLTVLENVLMGRRLVRDSRGLNWRRSAKRAIGVLDQLNLDLDPFARTGDLKPDQQQMVEIARAVSMNARILILDEPTSSLAKDEVSSLFELLRTLRTQHVTTILVSHRLPELFEICDSITVLRDGRSVLETSMSAVDSATLVESMVGSPTRQRTRTRSQMDPGGASSSALRTRGLTTHAVADIDLDVQRGEIVGLAGLAGSGCGELLETLFECPISYRGQILLFDRAHRPAGARDSLANGVAYLPPDRKTMGLNLQLTIADNLALSATRNRHRLSSRNGRSERAAALTMSRRMQIAAPSVRDVANTLSGGNQQKVALARCLSTEPRLLLLNEPTRGVDVAARAEIHGLLSALATEGTAIILTSSETDELLDISDRILVMRAGRIVSELTGASATEAEIARTAGGHS